MTERLDDPKVAFFVRNEPLMNQWLAVQPRVWEEADRFYNGLRREQPPTGAVLSPERHVKSYPAWTQLRFYKENWPGNGDGMGPCVWFEWHKESTFTSGQLCLGIRSAPDQQPGQDIYRKLLEQHNDPTRAPWQLGEAGEHWRVWLDRDTAPDLFSPDAEDKYWDDLNPYREKLVRLIHESWPLLSAIVDGALKDRR